VTDALGSLLRASHLLAPDDLAAAFDLDHHLRHIDVIFRRVFEETDAR